MINNVSEVAAKPGGVLDSLLRRSLNLRHQGKVRDTYYLRGHGDKLLVIATDRISIFDFVLSALVPYKGEVLTAMTIFWLTTVFRDIKHHLLAYGSAIDWYLPKELAENPELHRRALVVKKKSMLFHEFIARGYMMGSGWRDYQKTGEICGIVLPPGLHEGSRLPEPIFTPSTKAAEGHDENVSAESVIEEHGPWVKELALELFQRAGEYALKRGIIIADTKFEFGDDGTVADELLTPDSSRYWGVEEYNLSQRYKKAPDGFDKEPVRTAGRKAEIDGRVVDILKDLDPKKAADRELVARWVVPAHVIDETTSRYLALIETLTEVNFRRFQTEYMNA